MHPAFAPAAPRVPTDATAPTDLTSLQQQMNALNDELQGATQVSGPQLLALGQRLQLLSETAVQLAAMATGGRAGAPTLSSPTSPGRYDRRCTTPSRPSLSGRRLVWD